MSLTIAMIAGEDWHFLSHRLGLALAAREAGHKVVVIVPPGKRTDEIRAHGFTVETVPISRNLSGVWRDLAAVGRVARVCRTHKVQLIHAFALKPILVGALAARLAGVRALVATISGMGYLFISRSAKARLVRAVVLGVFRALLARPGTAVIVQNQDDLAAVTSTIAKAEQTHLVRGSGVDPAEWPLMPEPDETPPLAVLPARMLWDKGVAELVEAARILKQRGVAIRIALAGDADPGNPRCIAPEQLQAWAAEGLVEWWGHQADMVKVWARAHIAVLPSYREGLPKALLEAASCGRPAVTTDVPGCRELVEHERNGLLVPVREAEPLADALERLAREPALRQRLGAEARHRLEAEFAAAIVHGRIIAIYDIAAARGRTCTPQAVC